MPKKKTPDLDPKEQFKRFQEAAKDAGVDEKDADQTFGKLAARDKKRNRTSK